MRIAYLFNQPASDAECMGADKVFIDTPGTNRAALTDLIDNNGLRAGDTLVASALSKLGRGAASKRIVSALKKRGITVDVCEVVSKPQRPRGKRRAITDAQRRYCRNIWISAIEPGAAITAISNFLRFDVDRNWLNYNVCLRDGSRFNETTKEPKE